MTDFSPRFRAVDDALSVLGVALDASLYLDRCQVDTPMPLVKQVWEIIKTRRRHIGKVVDFGAGDARFARHGSYKSYLGYEIDPSRCSLQGLPQHAEIVNACAFSEDICDASLCIGNPPYVRNQDLPEGWRQTAAAAIERRTGVKISGLANAWQYFFLLSLASTHKRGLVALVVPFEWVSRPSSKMLREFIQKNGWGVSVYRMQDKTFDRVLTTSSITIIDKAVKSSTFEYFRAGANGSFSKMHSPTGGKHSVLAYKKSDRSGYAAKRGLSPGTQEFLTLTEAERARCALRVGTDVIACVTSLRPISADELVLTDAIFRRDYVDGGYKCWLVRTDRKPSIRLQRYFDSVPEAGYQTSTCLGRSIWWKFTMPATPKLLMATGFQKSPKVLVNQIGAKAVGGVCGLYGIPEKNAKSAARQLHEAKYTGRVVSHSNGLHKLEINQINSLLSTLTFK